MRSNILAAVFATVTLLAPAASADVRLTIHNGQVNLSATDATVRQILAEWARVGQTTIVNADRMAASPRFWKCTWMVQPTPATTETTPR